VKLKIMLGIMLGIILEVKPEAIIKMDY